MKVKYMKEHLQNLPDDMEVLISHHDGYERVYTHDFGVYPGTAGYVDYEDRYEVASNPKSEEQMVFILDV
jgi:hypothetical protein